MAHVKDGIYGLPISWDMLLRGDLYFAHIMAHVKDGIYGLPISWHMLLRGD
jgi:predicted nicotinamide N-methyase